MKKCIFCQIVAGESFKYPVYEDQDFLAFMDIRPINPGHVVIVPKEHLGYLFDLPQRLYDKVFILAKDLAGPLRKVTGSQRIGLAVEGFGVDHAHVHLIPVNHAGELDPHRAKPMNLNKLKILAEKIRKEIGL